jgi:fused signal recognition particle receptor
MFGFGRKKKNKDKNKDKDKKDQELNKQQEVEKKEEGEEQLEPEETKKKVEGEEQAEEKAEEEEQAEPEQAEEKAAFAEEEKPNEGNKTGIIGRLRSRLAKTRETFAVQVRTIFRRGTIDDELFDDLEATLIQADLGVKTTLDLIEKMRARVKRNGLKEAQQLYTVLEQELIALMKPLEEAAEALTEDKHPFVILVIGVNGVGKTTTIGKLAYLKREENKKVLVAASDTFRAAAVEQLEIWAQRADSDIVKHKSGADPAAVAYDALSAAIARKMDYLIIDTAGRLHTKTNLMEELKKIKRVLGKLDPTAPHEVLMVLDATTGQNALSQARLFTEALGVTGIVLTKLDGTAKGGIVIAIHQEFGIPVKYIGVGEGIDDLKPFHPEEFVRALFED